MIPPSEAERLEVAIEELRAAVRRELVRLCTPIVALIARLLARRS